MAAPPSRLVLLLSVFLLLNVVSQATVPPGQTFTFVNDGELGPYITEYNADYRALPPYASPFQLCFYNTTPNAYYLAVRLGTLRAEALFRWVWEANRGRPVRENAAFSLLSDGNLVLTDADHRVVWSTGTANKGVTGFKLLSTGNMVLHDARGRYVWQSFDYPTDTLLVGQSLRVAGPSKLVSRASAVDGNPGVYSAALNPGGLALYMSNAGPKPLPYYNYATGRMGISGSLTTMKFQCLPGTITGVAYEMSLVVSATVGGKTTTTTEVLSRTGYNCTYSMLRLQLDGNLVAFTFIDDDDDDTKVWENPFAFFSDERGFAKGCVLPGKCGTMGVCDEETCKSCPTAKGLVPWSKSCQTPKLGACGKAVDYYKVVRVESFLTGAVTGEKGVKVAECRRRCDVDCGCKGFMYWEETSTCWLAPIVGTLFDVASATHVAYIKYAK